MNLKFIENAILLDYSDVVVEEVNINNLVSHTANTWQSNRSSSEKQADTQLGKFAEDAVITALEVLGINCYHSYDSFRSDNFKLHAPFDGLLIRRLNTQLVNEINASVVNDGAKLSAETRENIRQNGGLTVEVKSTRLAQKYKNRAGFVNYDYDNDLVSLVNELSNLDFLTYPYFTRYGDMTFDQYCWYVETHHLHSCKRGDELRNIVKNIELANASDIYIRVFIDEVYKKILILGCIDRYRFFESPRTHKLILPGKSEVPLYFVRAIRDGYSLEYLGKILK